MYLSEQITDRNDSQERGAPADGESPVKGVEVTEAMVCAGVEAAHAGTGAESTDMRRIREQD